MRSPCAYRVGTSISIWTLHMFHQPSSTRFCMSAIGYSMRHSYIGVNKSSPIATELMNPWEQYPRTRCGWPQIALLYSLCVLRASARTQNTQTVIPRVVAAGDHPVRGYCQYSMNYTGTHKRCQDNSQFPLFRCMKRIGV